MIKSVFSNKCREYLEPYGLRDIDDAHLHVETFSRNEKLVEQGTHPLYIYVVFQGKAKITITTPEGKTFLISIVNDNSLIGEVELFMSSKTQKSVTAMTTVKAVAIPLKYYRHYLRNNVAFLNKICELLTKKLNRNTSNSAINILAPVKTRLCAYIMNDRMENLTNLSLIASTLGVSYRHILRVVQTLCREGGLKKKESGYAIDNYDLVSKYAGDLEPTINSN